MLVDEKILIAALKEGKMEAWKEFVDSYQSKIYGLALCMLKNRTQAEDITQEVFIAAYKGIGSFRADSSLKTWLYRITANLASKFIRDVKSKEKKTLSLNEPIDCERELYIQIPDRGANPARILEEAEEQTTIKDAVENLPEAYRTTLILRIIDGLSYDEIAKVLKCSIGTVKSRLHNATVIVGKQIQEYFKENHNRGSR